MFDSFDPFLLSPEYQQQVNEQIYNDLLVDALTDNRSAEDVLDYLSSNGVNPDKWIDSTAAELEYVVDAGIRFKQNHFGLFVPSNT